MMNILVVDDEILTLNGLVDEIKSVFLEASIYGSNHPKEALTYVEKLCNAQEILSYAFLDIQLGALNGIELAKLIKDRQPNTKIIFCTAYSQFAATTSEPYAIGYLLNPILAENIIHTLNFMDQEWINDPNPLSQDLRVQTFGIFKVFVKKNLLTFENEKAKELLAFLIHQNGAIATFAQISVALWADQSPDWQGRRKVKIAISSLKKTLKRVGIHEIFIKKWNGFAIDTTKIKCDKYDFLEGNTLAVNTYHGEYMVDYPWAKSF